MDWKGKRTLITGASRGIGRSIALQLAEKGARLLLAARTEKDLESVKAECEAKKADAHIVVADVSLPHDCKNAVKTARELLGGLDVLILNAGLDIHSNFADLPDLTPVETINRVNFLGPVFLTHHALPVMEAGSRIVVVSSLQGKTGFPGSAVYSGTKHALHGFFDSLRMELRPRNIGITIVCPGAVESTIRSGDGYDASMLMPTAECARQILRAAELEKRELIMTWKGRFGNVLRTFFPGLVDGMVESAVKRFYNPGGKSQ